MVAGPWATIKIEPEVLMKSFGMLKLSLIVAGAAAVLSFPPACRAQEVTNDHFTDTGLQDVYDGGPAKQATPKKVQKPAVVQVQAHQKTRPTATVHATAERAPVLSAQAVATEVAEKRKTAPKPQKKQ